MSIYQQHKPTSGGGDFLKLKDGDKVKLRIVSEPAGTLYKLGDKLRYAWIVYNRDEGRAQIFTSGISIYSQIADLVDDWGEPTEFDISVKRTGSGPTDTTYSVTPVKVSKDLSEEEWAECQELDLLKLTRGRWLKDIEKDGVLPDPAVEATYDAQDGDRQSFDYTDSDIPADFLDGDNPR